MRKGVLTREQAELIGRSRLEGIPLSVIAAETGTSHSALCNRRKRAEKTLAAALDTRAPGDHSRLQLVETLESAARTAEAHRALPTLPAGPDADLDLTDRVRFPPYSPRR